MLFDSLSQQRSDPRSLLLFSPLQPSVLNLVPPSTIPALCLDDIVIRHATGTFGIWQDPKISRAITDACVEVLARTLLVSPNATTCAVWTDVQMAALSLARLQKGKRCVHLALPEQNRGFYRLHQDRIASHC